MMGHKTLTGAIQGKFWGSTRCFFENSTSEVHYIEANKGGYCSRHYHQDKWNRFIVLEGKLKITIYKESDEDVTVLTDGMFSDVPPGVEHRFEALENSKALEVYWVNDLDPKDIVRKDTGGSK
jgi:mannose-6-phosphate isomerase-like protein (cupin superfamily)